MKTTGKRAARVLLFIVKSMLNHTFQPSDSIQRWTCQGLSGNTTYENDDTFVEAFEKRFPGRKNDPNLYLASARLRKWLYAFYWNGTLWRDRVSNHDISQNEPSWQYVYTLPQHLLNDLQTDIETPESWVAERCEVEETDIEPVNTDPPTPLPGNDWRKAGKEYQK